MIEGSRWFRRFCKEVKAMSPDVRIRRVKYGFYRIFYRNAYIHEVYKEMPQFGYDWDDLDPRLEDKRYFEEYEDDGEVQRKIKNYVEGYYESIDRVRTRVYLMKNNAEFAKDANQAFDQFYVK